MITEPRVGAFGGIPRYCTGVTSAALTRSGVLITGTALGRMCEQQDALHERDRGLVGPPCAVCGRPTGDIGPGPCPTCGLPAAAQAALVVARIGATLADIARDRDALRGHPPGVRARTAARSSSPVPRHPRRGLRRPRSSGRRAPPRPPRRRLSPQQVLVGLGALLVVAAALAFVAVAWTRFGVVFQAGVMLVVTALLCGASAWTARRGLRATEEALAAAGAALLAVDLGAARALGPVPARGRRTAALVGDLLRRGRRWPASASAA